MHREGTSLIVDTDMESIEIKDWFSHDGPPGVLWKGRVWDGSELFGPALHPEAGPPLDNFSIHLPTPGDDGGRSPFALDRAVNDDNLDGIPDPELEPGLDSLGAIGDGPEDVPGLFGQDIEGEIDVRLDADGGILWGDFPGIEEGGELPFEKDWHPSDGYEDEQEARFGGTDGRHDGRENPDDAESEGRDGREEADALMAGQEEMDADEAFSLVRALQEGRVLQEEHSDLPAEDGASLSMGSVWNMSTEMDAQPDLADAAAVRLVVEMA